jgi:hypothetical protein
MRRRRRQRHTNETSTALVVSTVSHETGDVPLTDTVRQVLEAEDRLRQLICMVEKMRHEAAVSLVAAVARQLNITPAQQEPVLALHGSWETKDNQLGEALDGLNDVLSMLVERKDFFKRHHKDELLRALTDMLAPLNDRKEAISSDRAALVEEIGRLQNEINDVKAGMIGIEA